MAALGTVGGGGNAGGPRGSSPPGIIIPGGGIRMADPNSDMERVLLGRTTTLKELKVGMIRGVDNIREAYRDFIL